MFYQITNVKKKRNNNVRVASMGALVKEIKKQGWNIADCKITELASDLVKNSYKELDGKMNKRGKQFAQRAGL
jgi:nucleoside diphosphate kinase